MKKLVVLIAITASTVSLAADRVKQFDFDRDGKVSFEDITHYCTASKKLFDRADKNGDGYLNNAELRAAKDYLLERCAEVPK